MYECLACYSDISAKADVTYRHLPVMESTSVPELIQNTLQKLGIEVLPRKIISGQRIFWKNVM